MGECGILAFGGAWIPIARRRVGLRLSILSYLHHALSRLVDSTAPAEERPLQLYRIHAGYVPRCSRCDQRTVEWTIFAVY